jgi:hypothetical protein
MKLWLSICTSISQARSDCLLNGDPSLAIRMARAGRTRYNISGIHNPFGWMPKIDHRNNEKTEPSRRNWLRSVQSVNARHSPMHSISEGNLPMWTDKFGFGCPMVMPYTPSSFDLKIDVLNVVLDWKPDSSSQRMPSRHGLRSISGSTQPACFLRNIAPISFPLCS